MVVHAGLLTDVHGRFFYALFPHRLFPHRGKEKKGTQLNVSGEIGTSDGKKPREGIHVL